MEGIYAGPRAPPRGLRPGTKDPLRALVVRRAAEVALELLHPPVRALPLTEAPERLDEVIARAVRLRQVGQRRPVHRVVRALQGLLHLGHLESRHAGADSLPRRE